MNSLILILFCVGFGAVSLSTFGSAYGAFEPSENYIIEAHGFSISEKTIDNSQFDMSFLTTTSGEKIIIQVTDASIFFQGKDFVFSKFDTSILRDGKFLRLVGVSEDPQGNELTLRLFGRLMGTSSDASVYEFKGKLDYNMEPYNLHFVGKTEKESKISEFSTEILDSEEKQVEMKTFEQTSEIMVSEESQTSEVKFKVLESHSERVHVGKSFNFLVKVYDTSTNPTNSFQHKGGQISGVEITAQIFDPQNNLVKTFEGTTYANGAFSDKFYFPIHFNKRLGTYYFNLTANYGDQQQTLEFPFFLLELKESPSSGP